MEKRVILALVLSSVVLLGYNYLVTNVYHLQPPAPVVLNKENPPAKPEPPPLPEIKQEALVPIPISFERKVLENENIKASFTNLGGALEEIYLKEFKRRFFETQLFCLSELAKQPFQLTFDNGRKLIYVYEDSQKRISKIYSISNNTIDLELIIQNLSSASLDLNLNLNYFSLDLQQEDADFKKEKNYFELAIYSPDKVLRKSLAKINEKNNSLENVKFDWIGLKDRYFCTIFKPEVSPLGYYAQLIDNKVVNVGIPLSIAKLEPRASANFKAKLFAGPLNTQVLNETDRSFGQIINFGFFDSISKVLLSTLRFIHKILPNWGVCIIVLSCLLFFVLYPLTLKSLKSMKAMQALQPEMEKMRLQYKDQPQKFNKEVMELYKKHHVNPFGGCLPMVLQIPIFIGLYQALLRSLELRGSGFLWIRDLSEADRLFILPYNIPVLGNELNILPILMAIIMFLQQRLTSKTTVSANPEQQRIMLIFFPILFGFMFYRMPSGLVLYWFVYSGLSFIFQRKQMAATPSE